MNINDVVVYIDLKGVEHNGLVKDVNQLYAGYLSLTYQDTEGRSVDVYDVPHMTDPSRQETNPYLPTFHLHCWKNRGEDHTPIPADHPMFDHPFEPVTKDDDGRRIPKPRPEFDAVVAEYVEQLKAETLEVTGVQPTVFGAPSVADLDAVAAEEAAKAATVGPQLVAAPEEPTPAQSEVPDYKELREQLNDATSVFYGPHECQTCGRIVIRRAVEEGGEAYEERDPNLGPPRYQLHACPATSGSITIVDAPRPE